MVLNFKTFMMHWSLALVCLLFCGTSASHFRGAMIFWKESDTNNSIDIDYRESWRRSSQNPECNDTTIKNNDTCVAEGQLVGVKTLHNIRDYTRQLFSEAFTYVCTDYSLDEDWQTGRGHMDFPYNKSSNITKYTFEFTGCCWIDSLVEGGGSSWQVQMKMDTSIRVDTGRMNESPRVDFPPLIRLMHGCSHTIRIPVSDGDGDAIKCRWANYSECGVIYDCFPNAVLDEDTCTITYNATYKKGWYPVAVQIEDFNYQISTQALSSVPLQFLVSVEDTNLTCTTIEAEKPKFVNFTLPDKACIGVTDDGFTTTIYIDSNVSISEVTTVSPIGLVKSTLQKSNETGYWHINVQWNINRTNSVNNVFCFTAVAHNGLTSEQRCVTLLAGVPPAEIIPATKSPSTSSVPPSQRTWSIEFDRDDLRATKPAYIYLYLSNGYLVEKIDVSTLNGVVFRTTADNRTHLQFTTSATLEEGQEYYFLFGQGLLQGKTYCGAESTAILDPNFWRFTVGSAEAHAVDVKCFRDGSEIQCENSFFNCTGSMDYNFESPCTEENIISGHTRFPHPTDDRMFVMCDLSGKTYLSMCPQGEIFYTKCRHCSHPNLAESSGCQTTASVTDNPCTKENIQAGNFLFPYPGDSSAFIHCDSWGHPWKQYCPSGEVWDQIDLTCIMPAIIDPCKEHGHLAQTLFPHTCDPHLFIHCDGNGQSFVQSCPLDLVFLPSAQTCVPQSFPGAEDLVNTCK